MSDDVTQSWSALGEQMSALRSLLHQRFGGASPHEAPKDDAEGATEKIRAALDEVVAATRQLGERIGDVARDDDVRASAKETMASLDDALRTTVDVITERIESVLKPSDRDDD
jgi:enamine deaminase RidA (YjgF/YER057c/UK114 family)